VALIWGGLDDAGRSLDDGAIFDPSTSTWGTIPVAPAGVSGTGSAVVWTGTEMIVWGGPNGSTGAAFNPTTNRWRVLPTAPIASPQLNSGVWTDTEVIVWANGQGAAYNPVIDTWRTISVSPLRPATPHGIWTGSEVVFLGGASDDNGLTESAAYQPTSDTWRLLAPGPAHPGLGFQWTGTTILAVVKGVVLQYDLTTDQWTEKTAPLPAQPFGSWTGHSYIFTTATNTSDLRIGAYTPNDITHAAPVSAYNLALPTARLTNDETSTARGTDVAVWTHDDGTYLTLTMIPIEPGGPVGVGTTTKIATFPTDRGQAWYGEQELPSAADGTAVSSLLWWQRPDGVVWLINAYWYGKSPPTDPAQRQQRFVEWALDITTPTEGTYQLSDPGITPIAAERAGDRRSRVRIWNYDNQQIIILVIEDAAASGLASALAKGRPERIYVDTHRGWTTGTSDIPVTIAWQVNDLTKEWATMTIPAALADKTAEIVHDVQSAG
jgi:hypothetical protein